MGCANSQNKFPFSNDPVVRERIGGDFKSGGYFVNVPDPPNGKEI